MEELKTPEEIKAQKDAELKAELEALELKRKAYEVSDRFDKVFTFPRKGKWSGRIIFFMWNQGFNSQYKEPDKAELVELIAKIMEHFPVGTEPFKIGMKDCKGQANLSPFRFDIKNPCRGQGHAEVEYRTADRTQIEIQFNWRTMFDSEMIGKEHYNPTDSQLHYFTGMSKHEIQKIRIPRHYLIGFPFIRFYGGDCTSYCEDETYLEHFKVLITEGREL